MDEEDFDLQSKEVVSDFEMWKFVNIPSVLKHVTPSSCKKHLWYWMHAANVLNAALFLLIPFRAHF